jgi:hypothetical protein
MYLNFVKFTDFVQITIILAPLNEGALERANCLIGEGGELRSCHDQLEELNFMFGGQNEENNTINAIQQLKCNDFKVLACSLRTPSMSVKAAKPIKKNCYLFGLEK